MARESTLFDEQMMREAIKEAQAALITEDVPVGAIVVYDGQIIGRGRNQREMLADPTAHAEIIAITAAAAARASWRLTGCTLYCTLEPCVMCAGAIVHARIDRLVFAADDPKAGACGSVYNIVEDRRLNHQVKLDKGPLAEECAQLLRDFFARQRAAGKK